MRRIYGICRRIIFLVGFVLTFTSSCKEDVPVELKLGDSYQGGVIFFLNDSGEHGLISAPSDQSNTDPWWNGVYVTTSAVSTSDGSGNTTAIITAQGNTGNYAARLCRIYRGGVTATGSFPQKSS